MSTLTKQEKTRRIVESALMIAMATVLSLVKIPMLFGGSVTLFSQLPILIIAYRYGMKWGLFTGATYGLLQLLLGMENLKYAITPWAIVAIILFDYLLAFAMLGFAGIFRNNIKQQGAGLAAGTVLGSVLRYLCHIISGFAVWHIFTPEGSTVAAYVFGYNATYMVPEAILCIIGSFALCAVLDFRASAITGKKRNAAV